MGVSSFKRMKINMHKLDVLESELGCRLILEREDIGEEVGFPEVEKQKLLDYIEVQMAKTILCIIKMQAEK